MLIFYFQQYFRYVNHARQFRYVTQRERERESNVPRVALKDGSNAVVRSHI